MYKFAQNPGFVNRTTDGMTIAIGNGTPEDHEYGQWVSAGNAPQPYVAPSAPVPIEVDMAQARLALLGAGLLATVNSAIAAMAGPAGEAARIEWEFRSTVRRNSALVVALAAQLGLDGAMLNQLFMTASGL